jgi:hypothetical protein
MQIKVEKEPYSIRKAISMHLILLLLYFSVAIAPALWLRENSLQDIAFIRWLNLLLVPVIFSLLLMRSSRKAHLHLTHLSEAHVIRQRLVHALKRKGYRVIRDLPQKVSFRSRFFPLNFLLGRGPLHLKEKKKSIQLSGPWSSIHQLEKMAHEGEIFLPNPR